VLVNVLQDATELEARPTINVPGNVQRDHILLLEKHLLTARPVQ